MKEKGETLRRSVSLWNWRVKAYAMETVGEEDRKWLLEMETPPTPYPSVGAREKHKQGQEE